MKYDKVRPTGAIVPGWSPDAPMWRCDNCLQGGAPCDTPECDRRVMTTPDPIEAAIVAGSAALFSFNTTAGHHFVMHDMGGEGDPYNQLAAIAIRAATPILIAAGREEAADKISALANAGWQVLLTTKAKDPILEAKLDALDEAARIARGGEA